MKNKLSFIDDVPILLTAVFGTKTMKISELISITKGRVIGLDKLAGEPIDLYINGRLLARGEVVIVNDCYGLRLVDIVDIKSIHEDVG